MVLFGCADTEPRSRLPIHNMGVFMRRVILLGFLLSAGLSVGAETAFVDFEHGWLIPQKLGGLAYTAVEKYDNADLGYTVFYAQGDDFKATVTLYNLGREQIQDGYQGENISLVFDSVKGLLELKQKQTKISGLKTRGSTIVPKKGAVRFSSTVYQYMEPALGGTQKIKSVYITGTHNNFLKLEFTFDLLEGKNARPIVNQMILQLIEMVQSKPSEQEILLACCDAFLYDPAGYGGRTAAQFLMGKAQTMEYLNVYTHLFVWPDGYRKPENADLLIAAYFAGMLQVVVPQQLESGGEQEAFVAMLETYTILRSKEQIKALPEFDEWVAAPDKKVLFDQLLIDE
jgi:hypothetical protein